MKLASRDATTPLAASAPETTTPAPAESVRMQPRPKPVVGTRIETPRIAEREAPKPRHVAQAATPAPVVATPPERIVPEPAPSIPPATAETKETQVNALSADLRKALPPLQLSMHMWDPDPAKRFVILDGERHVEGDSVGPMRIRRIDADGVLFDWQGRAVRLPLR
jgi:general secretion pathway protein B